MLLKRKFLGVDETPVSAPRLGNYSGALVPGGVEAHFGE